MPKGWLVVKHGFFVHFPIALLLTSLAMDLYAMWKGREDIRKAASYNLLAGVAAGFLAFGSGVVAGEVIEHRVERVQVAPEVVSAIGFALEVHRGLALLTMAVFVVLAVWRYVSKDFGEKEIPSLYMAGAILGVGLLLATGYFGGNMREAEEHRARGDATAVQQYEGNNGGVWRFERERGERRLFERFER